MNLKRNLERNLKRNLKRNRTLQILLKGSLKGFTNVVGILTLSGCVCAAPSPCRILASLAIWAQAARKLQPESQKEVAMALSAGRLSPKWLDL